MFIPQSFRNDQLCRCHVKTAVWDLKCYLPLWDEKSKVVILYRQGNPAVSNTLSHFGVVRCVIYYFILQVITEAETLGMSTCGICKWYCNPVLVGACHCTLCCATLDRKQLELLTNHSRPWVALLSHCLSTVLQKWSAAAGWIIYPRGRFAGCPSLHLLCWHLLAHP